MKEITKTEDQSPKSNQIIWLVLGVITIFVYFFGLNMPLLGPDEPRYAQVAREMYERSDWITPTLGGFDWFEKPALLYWLQITFYNLFGVNEFAARTGSALFGLGIVLCFWILGKFAASENIGFNKESETLNRKSSYNFANWLALIASSSLGIITFSHGGSFDIILTFPITAALVGFYIYDLKQRRVKANTASDASEKISTFSLYFPLFVFYFFVGVSLIAKGLVGILFPFAIVIFYYVLRWQFPSRAFILSLFLGTILSILVASIWYLPMYQVNGWKFIDEFFIQHHFQRYTSNKYQHPQPFYFFFWVLPLMTIPWLPFFGAAVTKFLRGIFPSDKSTEASAVKRNSALSTFAMAWLLVPLVFFSISGSKLPGYILPAVPGAILLAAEYIYRYIQTSKTRAYILQGIAFLTFIIVIVLLQFGISAYAPHESVKSLVAIANENGYGTSKIGNFHTISHNLEFYGAGRLIRTDDGKLRRFDGLEEIVNQLKAQNKPLLILVPLEHVKQLTESNLITTKVLGDNTELAIVTVELPK